MRWGVTIAYSILLLAGVWVINVRKPPPSPEQTAVRQLDPGAIVLPGDLSGPRLQPRYARRLIHPGEIVRAGDLASFPQLNWSGAAVPVAFGVGRNLVESHAIMVGKNARICEKNKVAIDAVPIKTVICGGDEPTCLVIVAVAADKADGLGKLFMKAAPTLQPEPADKPSQPTHGGQSGDTGQASELTKAASSC